MGLLECFTVDTCKIVSFVTNLKPPYKQTIISFIKDALKLKTNSFMSNLYRYVIIIFTFEYLIILYWKLNIFKFKYLFNLEKYIQLLENFENIERRI